MSKTKHYYLTISTDVRWLYEPGEVLIKVYPRQDRIIYSKYDPVKDETKVKVHVRGGEVCHV